MKILMDKIGMSSKATITKELKQLEENCLLVVEADTGRENRYTFLEEFKASPDSQDPVANVIIPYASGNR
jgi:hypothetical protein